MRKFISTVFVLSLVVSGSVAQAAEPAHAATRARTSRIRGGAGGEIRLAPASQTGPTELEPILVDGRIAKPGVFYVLSRASVRWADLQTQPDFVSRIARDALRHAP